MDFFGALGQRLYALGFRDFLFRRIYFIEFLL